MKKVLTTFFYWSALILFLLSLSARGIAFFNTQKPTFGNVKTIEMIDIKNDSLSFILTLEVDNKSILPIRIEESILDIFSPGEKLGQVIVSKRTKIPGRSSKYIIMHCSINMEKSISFFSPLSDSIYLTAEGMITTNQLGLKKKIFVTFLANFHFRNCLARMLERDIDKIFFIKESVLTGLTLNQAEVWFEYIANNPYERPFFIENYEGEMKINGNFAGICAIVPPNFLLAGAQNIPGKLVFNLESLQPFSYSINSLLKGDLNYECQGKLAFKVFDNFILFPYNFKGKITRKEIVDSLFEQVKE